MKTINIIGVFFVILITASCITQDKCWKKFPPKESDSSSYRETSKDTSKIIPADSSMSKYLVECAEKNGKLYARISQLLTQQSGQYVEVPVATLDTNGILTATVRMPEIEIHWQIRSYHYAAVKSKVYVKITNVLLGWQKWLMWIGAAAIISLLAAGAFIIIKKRFFK